jgi:hypothetical protein
MSDPFTRVPLHEAVTSLGLDQHFGNRTTLSQFVSAEDKIAEVEADPARFSGIDVNGATWRDSFRKRYPGRFDVLRYPENAKIDGNFNMDAAAGRGIAGVVVDGDFELKGSIINWEIDTTATFLWVRGNFRCHNIVFGCMDLVVDGNVTADGLIVASYNHGHMLIKGNVHADRVIIDDDGPSAIGGHVKAKGWNASPNASVDLRSSEWIEEIRPEFRDEFFDEDGGFTCDNGNVDLVNALMAGRDILRDDKPKTKARAKAKR